MTGLEALSGITGCGMCSDEKRGLRAQLHGRCSAGAAASAVPGAAGTVVNAVGSGAPANPTPALASAPGR